MDSVTSGRMRTSYQKRRKITGSLDSQLQAITADVVTAGVSKLQCVTVLDQEVPGLPRCGEADRLLRNLSRANCVTIEE